MNPKICHEKGSDRGPTSRMRILVISISSAPRMDVGAKRFAFIGQQWTAQGHLVETLARSIMASERTDLTLPHSGCVHWIRPIFPRTLSGSGLIARIYNRLIRDIVGIPDPEVGWFPTSVWAGRNVCSRLKPDVIVATGPSFTSFLTGATLSRRTGVPLILDYRDPWTAFEWADTRAGRRMRSPYRRMLERWAVGAASAAVFTTELLRKEFESHYDGKLPGLLSAITNGFVPQEGVAGRPIVPGAFNILYAGTLYGERRLSNLAEAVERLRKMNTGQNREFAIHLFGQLKPDDRGRLERAGLQKLVHEHEPVEHNTVLEYMRGADALFLPSGSDVQYALPLKAFDYLSACRPILAVSPPGSAVANLMADVDCGEIARSDEPAAIADALRSLIDRCRQYTYAGRERYTWLESAKRYQAVVREVVDAHGVSGRA